MNGVLPSNFEINDYLRDKDPKTNRGTCIKCNRTVFWSRISVAKHKRATCDIDNDERELWNYLKSFTKINDVLPSNFEIKDYLRDKHPKTNRGTCIKCNRTVFWSRISVAKHKRATCDIDNEERELWKGQTTTKIDKAEASKNIQTTGEDDGMPKMIFNTPKIVISDYLVRETEGQRRASCKSCGKFVFMSVDNLSKHKRANCNISEEEIAFWMSFKKPETKNQGKSFSVDLSLEEAKEYYEMFQQLKIDDYLNKGSTRLGVCKICEAVVHYTKNHVVRHKKRNCTINEEEKEYWRTIDQSRLITMNPLSTEEARKYQELHKNLKISDYLINTDKKTGYGQCRVCHTLVYGSKDHLGRHKRKNCNISEEEKDFWVKIQYKLPALTMTSNDQNVYETNEDHIADIPCDHCPETFKSLQSWRDHTNIHVNPYICDYCQEKFGTKNHLRIHFFKHIRGDKTGNYCKLCKCYLPQEIDLKQHKLEFHSLKFSKESELGRLIELFEAPVEPTVNFMMEPKMERLNENMITEVFIKEEQTFDEEFAPLNETTGGETRYFNCCQIFFQSFTELAKHESTEHPESFREMVDSLKDLLLTMLTPETNTFEPKVSIKDQEDQNEIKKPIKSRLTKISQELISKNINIDCNLCQNTVQASLFEEHLMYEHPFEDPVIAKTNSKFICNCCIASFPSILNCIKHLQTADHQLEGLTCQICGAEYQNLQELNKHRTEVHSDKSLVFCDKCQKSFNRLRDLKFHMLSHNGKKASWCNLCGNRFLSPEDLGKHTEKYHKNEQDSVCAHCGLRVKGSHKLRVHIRSHHKNPKKAAEDVKPVDCLECNETFMGTKRLQAHIHRKHREQDLRFKCGDCNKYFSSNKHLREHEVVHTREVNFFCEICNKGFTRKRTLLRHINTHDDSTKTLVCTYCPKRFRSKHNLKRHVLSHTGEKNQICPDCNARFADRNCLNKHMERSHGHSLPGYGELYNLYKK